MTPAFICYHPAMPRQVDTAFSEKAHRYTRRTIQPLLTIVIAMCWLAGAISLAEAQQPAKVARIGLALGGTATSMKYLVDAFHQGLRELGYIEGKNVLIEYRYTEGQPERSAEIAEKLIGLKPDLIVVSSTGLTAACKNATNTIPIVVGNAGDLVGTRLVGSLARPGGNITGSTNMAPIWRQNAWR